MALQLLMRPLLLALFAIASAGCARTLAPSPADTATFLAKFPPVSKAPEQLLSHDIRGESGSELTLSERQRCLALLNRSQMLRKVALGSTSGLKCFALSSFRLGSGITAYQIRLPRPDLRVARGLLVFRGTTFLDSLLVADYQTSPEETREISSTVSDVDGDGDLDLMLADHRRFEPGARLNGTRLLYTTDGIEWQGSAFGYQLAAPPGVDDNFFEELGITPIGVKALPPFLRETSTGYALTLADGKVAALSDIRSEAGWRVYRYLPSRLEPEIVAFEVHDTNSRAVQLLNRRDGGTITLPGDPIVSPSKDWVVAASNRDDEYYAAGGCGLEIWGIANGRITKSVALPCPANTALVDSPRWASADTVLFSKVATPSGSKVSSQLRLSGGEWTER